MGRLLVGQTQLDTLNIGNGLDSVLCGGSLAAWSQRSSFPQFEEGPGSPVDHPAQLDLGTTEVLRPRADSRPQLPRSAGLGGGRDSAETAGEEAEED